VMLVLVLIVPEVWFDTITWVAASWIWDCRFGSDGVRVSVVCFVLVFAIWVCCSACPLCKGWVLFSPCCWLVMGGWLCAAFCDLLLCMGILFPVYVCFFLAPLHFLCWWKP
jgi:hypothetical protein